MTAHQRDVFDLSSTTAGSVSGLLKLQTGGGILGMSGIPQRNGLGRQSCSFLLSSRGRGYGTLLPTEALPGSEDGEVYCVGTGILEVTAEIVSGDSVWVVKNTMALNSRLGSASPG